MLTSETSTEPFLFLNIQDSFSSRMKSNSIYHIPVKANNLGLKDGVLNRFARHDSEVNLVQRIYSASICRIWRKIKYAIQLQGI